MKDTVIITKMQEYLHAATTELCAWLQKMLPRVGDDWWQVCVLDNLSYAQRAFCDEHNFTKLEDFDLAALLRIADRSWYDMRTFAYLPTQQRQCVKNLIKVRNNWAHLTSNTLEKDLVLSDLDAILDFFENVILVNTYTQSIYDLKAEIEATDFSAAVIEEEPVELSGTPQSEQSTDYIQERDMVYLTGNTAVKGMVFSIEEIEGIKKYEVFVEGELRSFYDGQIKKVEVATQLWGDIVTLQSNLTAHEINNPSANNLYSLNAARIEFVPYQFRPALKLIKSDEPKILIADSVGVGKTIEAGLIIKELEARNEAESILIICPKPLVAERKWELEMKRFDEDFVPMDGSILRQAISDTHRDEEWPVRYNKAIIPYSILDGRVYEGNTKHKGKEYGLQQLNPAPHFDLVIVDEAHHIRNGSLEKEKAFAYKCVRFFCEHADAVVMLTATPLQTSNDDLFTLMNLLRPDVVLDKEVFNIMSRPNEYIYQCSHAIRGAADGWREVSLEAMKKIPTTQWGESVIAKNPLYADILARLQQSDITREERVKLISDVESLHSFNTMLNRTRRKDIQDFCVRRSFTVETAFTEQQAELHDELLQFEYEALAKLHHIRSIPFMMSTIRRQAASCIFGLAPHIRDFITRRFNQMVEDPDIDLDEFDLDAQAASALMNLAQHVLQLADDLPEDDPKFENVLKVIEEKQHLSNNKIILFSSFRHTLSYLEQKLKERKYRVAQINGSIKDDERRSLRKRFEMEKDDPRALDLLLFTEVGSEGLDYQFCDTMINYDLPWNPMRIEQRIGRIDRRGQKSEAVNIYNVITADTVDADIYNRCLMRIGIFERSIGECEAVLGEIGAQIERIAITTNLTAEERCQKLEQMADNEVRRMQELNKLEDEERALFGFDLSNYTASKEIKDADSPWVSPANIQQLVERYLSQRLGDGKYIVGNSGLKQLRLNKIARMSLLEDLRAQSNIPLAQKRKWENYLKGSEPMHLITFLAESASEESKAFFITPMHPLVKQAANYFASNEITYVNLDYYSEDLPQGQFPFSIFVWNYTGLNPRFRVVPICDNELVLSELASILQEAVTANSKPQIDKNMWKVLEKKHVAFWQQEKQKFLETVKTNADYRLESIGSNYRSRKRSLEQKINDTVDEKLIRMYQSMLDTATENYQSKVSAIEQQMNRADIHTVLIANGLVNVKRG